MKYFIMQYNNNENSSIHRAMIDLLKAFHEIIHDIFENKLLKSSLPKILVRPIGHMLKNTFNDVCFNNKKGRRMEKINKGSRHESWSNYITIVIYILHKMMY